MSKKNSIEIIICDTKSFYSEPLFRRNVIAQPIDKCAPTPQRDYLPSMYEFNRHKTSIYQANEKELRIEPMVGGNCNITM